MMTNDLDCLDFDRKRNTSKTTDAFTGVIKRLSKLYVGMSSSGMSRFLLINVKTILNWEEAGLIFPKYKGKSRTRYYALKDILRGLVIKYLMSELGFRKFSGVKLLLEMTNRGLKDHRKRTIDNIYVDKYILRVLNLDVEQITQMKLHGNSRRLKHVDDENS